MNALDLTDASALEHWTGRWEGIGLETVLRVNTEHDVLLRQRASWRARAKDSDYPGLSERLRKQPQRHDTASKRAGQALVSPPKKVARTSPDSEAFTNRTRPSSPELVPELLHATVPNLESHGRSRSPSVEVLSPHPLPRAIAPLPQRSLLLHPTPSTQASESNSAGAKRRTWPTDFTVDELWSGFAAIQKAIDRTGTYEKAEFMPVFGCKYTKSTVVRNKALLLKALPELRVKYASKKWSDFLSILRKQQPELFDKSSHSAIRSPFDDLSPPSTSVESAPASTQPAEPDSTGTASLVIDSPSAAASDNDDNNDFSEFFPDLESGLPLCDFCDETMTATPSARLLEMRRDLEKTSWPSPGVNPNHRTARRATDFYPYCERHRLETEYLPMAVGAGWPTDPDFSSLYPRLLRLRDVLDDVLIQDLEDNLFFTSVAEEYKAGTSAAAAGNTANQFAAFGAETKVRTAG